MGLTGLCCRLYTSARKQNDSDDCSQEKKPDFPGHSPKYFLRLARRGEVEVTIIRLITCSFFSFFFFFLVPSFRFSGYVEFVYNSGISITPDVLHLLLQRMTLLIRNDECDISNILGFV